MRRYRKRFLSVMEFLVQIQVNLPPEMSSDVKAELLVREQARGRELRDAGTITRIWRIPGRLANVGIWDALDATSLHAAIESLPLYPYIDHGHSARGSYLESSDLA